MKVLKYKKIEGCLEGSNVKDILLDDWIDRDFVLYLGKLGKLVIDEGMSKPFFRIIVKGKYTIKGSQKNMTIRLLLPEKEDENIIPDLTAFIEEWKADEIN